MLKEYLNAIHPCDSELLSDYIAQWEPYSIPRNTLMTSPGKVERFMYFVQEGIQHSYYLDGEKKHVIAFTYPPSFTGIPESFLSQTPADYFLETLTDSAFIRISYEKHQQLLAQNPALDTLFRKAAEQLLIDTLKRYHALMANDMETRFKDFMKRSPHLLGMVSQKNLASYLRMDPTNFSKLLATIKI